MASTAVAPARSGEVVPATGLAEPVELLLYWRVINKRKWWIFGIAIAIAVLTAIVVSRVTPIYRATVTLLIEQGKAKLVSIDEVYSGVSANREHYQTQAEMLRSPAIATAVIKKLRLNAHPEFDPRQRQGDSLSALIPGRETDRRQKAWTPEQLDSEVLTTFLRRITIEPVRLSQLVKLGFDSADPKLAATIANAIAEAYIDADIEIRARITQKAGDWLAERLGSLKQNLEDSERALQSFREREGLLDTRELAQGGTTNQFEQVQRALTEVRQARADAENSYMQVKGAKGSFESLPIVMRTPALERLKAAESEAEKRVAALAERYGPDHPRMQEAQQDLRLKRENTQRAIDAVVASFAKEYEVAKANERSVERSLLSTKGAIQNINRKEFQLDALQRDVDTNRQIYERFLNRYRETRAAGNTQASVVARIVDPAIPPLYPYKPRKREIVLIGLLAGLLLAAMGALLRERLDNTVKTGDEVEEKLGVPTLAVLPLVTEEGEEPVGKHYLTQPSSIFSEAVRTARTGLMLSSVDSPNKLLLVTSSIPGEGKSSFAANLALAHAQTKKTLLIEADLRRPSLVAALDLDTSKPGLASVFAGTATLSDCLQRVPGSSLYVLPAGTGAANPLELLSSERFRQMLTRIAAACEVVIIDSPPLHLVSDSVVLGTIASGVIFVVKAESTPYPLARRCIRTLQSAGANVIGVALNQLDFSKAAKYYGGYTEYAKEYGKYETAAAPQA